MAPHTLKSGLKARIGKMTDFRNFFKERVDLIQRSAGYTPEQRARFADPQAREYLANVGMHLDLATELIDSAVRHIKATNGQLSVITTLGQLKAKLTDYAHTPVTDNASRHLDAAMSIINDKLSDDLQQHSTPPS